MLEKRRVVHKVSQDFDIPAKVIKQNMNFYKLFTMVRRLSSFQLSRSQVT